MKNKKEILKMSKGELQAYKWSDDLDLKKEEDTNSYCYNCSDCSNCSKCSHCSDCSDCYNCSDCYDCYDCSNCLYCRNLKGKGDSYYICNVEVTKEEFEKKKKELEL